MSKNFNYLPGKHSPSELGTHPSAQVHTIVLTGTEFKTLHIAVLEHGFNALQGSTHSLLIQANLFGQSVSILHSGSNNFTGVLSQNSIGFPSGR